MSNYLVTVGRPLLYHSEPYPSLHFHLHHHQHVDSEEFAPTPFTPVLSLFGVVRAVRKHLS